MRRSYWTTKDTQPQQMREKALGALSMVVCGSLGFKKNSTHLGAWKWTILALTLTLTLALTATLKRDWNLATIKAHDLFPCQDHLWTVLDVLDLSVSLVSRAGTAWLARPTASLYAKSVEEIAAARCLEAAPLTYYHYYRKSTPES